MSEPKYLAQDHAVRPAGLSKLRHPGVRRLEIVAKNYGMGFAAGLVLSFAIVTILAVGLRMQDIRFDTIAVFLAMTFALTVFIGTACLATEADEIDQNALKSLAKDAKKAIARSLNPSDVQSLMLTDERGREFNILPHVGAAMEETSDPEAMLLRRSTIVRLAAVEHAYQDSIARLGTASKDEAGRIRREAVLSIARDTARQRRAMEIREHEAYERDAGGAIEDLRAAVGGALRLGIHPGTQPLQRRAGTGRAHVDRLIAKAEEALAIDPDLVDANGARIDAAIREHLPRLLRRHAETAKHVRIEDLARTDALLDDGVEMIRTSVEEGLDGLRDERADALRTEIAFLRLRRAPAAGSLDDAAG